MSQRHVAISTSHAGASERRAYWADLVCAHLVKLNCVEVTQPARLSGPLKQGPFDYCIWWRPMC